MARAVVFGGTGFLGRRVVALLAGDRHEVCLASRHPHKVAGDIPETVQLAAVDIRDGDQVARALAGAQAAVNCVSLYLPTSKVSYDDIHVTGARNVAAAAAAAGVGMLVHISGIGADPASASEYVGARGRGEEAVLAACPNAAILRPSVMFGPGDSFLNAIAGVAALTPVIPLFGDGKTRLQPVFVDDVAKAAAAAIEKGHGGIMELGGPELLCYRDIVERVLGWTGRRRLLMPVPMAVWTGIAAIAEHLPSAPVTRAQVALMRQDNVVRAASDGFAQLRIKPRYMHTIAPGYLAEG